MSNSALVVYKNISPNKTVNRNNTIDRITPHCVVGQISAESLGNWFAQASTQASSNYGIDKNGRVGMYVEEKDRSWCTCSGANDHRAVTIECASDTTHPYAMNVAVYEKLIELCVDICKRNGKTKLLWIADKDRALNYKLANDEMLITVHRWFAPTECPGDWLYGRLGDLASKVTTKLNVANENSNAKYYVQVGPCDNKEEVIALANKLKIDGFDVVVKAEEIIDVNVKENIKEPEEVIFNEGDKVKMQRGAPVYGASFGFQDFVYNSTLFVRSVEGDKIIVSTVVTGPITGAVHKKYLTKV